MIGLLMAQTGTNFKMKIMKYILILILLTSQAKAQRYFVTPDAMNTAMTAKMNYTDTATAFSPLWSAIVGKTSYTYVAANYATLASIPSIYKGSFSQTGTATTIFTVTLGTTLGASTYKVIVTPTAPLSAALFYVTAKTTTQFEVRYLAGLTGVVSFDWMATP